MQERKRPRTLRTERNLSKKAEELGIQLVFLPKYSPHLNPIEPLWRELKYALSRVFVTDEDAFQSLVQLSYAVDWIDTFLTDFKKLRQ